MTYSELVNRFLEKVQVIKNLNPAYKQPGDGSGGVCDCIGLVIGAIRRMGLSWKGIHGSNYAARYEAYNLEKIKSVSDLDIGDVVLKAYERGDSKWSLPARYHQGNSYYNGDLRDYYHAGVVTKLSPQLNITHMTSPKMKVDTSLGKWAYHFKAKPIVNASSNKDDIINGHVKPIPEPSIPVAETGSKAVVYAENGAPVKMRQYPSTSCRTWVNVPVGTKVTIVNPGEDWAKIDGYGRSGWYMMAKFLDVIGDGKGKY